MCWKRRSYWLGPGCTHINCTGKSGIRLTLHSMTSYRLIFPHVHLRCGAQVIGQTRCKVTGQYQLPVSIQAVVPCASGTQLRGAAREQCLCPNVWWESSSSILEELDSVREVWGKRHTCQQHKERWQWTGVCLCRELLYEVKQQGEGS